MATPLDRIKILEPRHPNRSTGIINGRTSGILNWNDIPYPSFYRAYKELSTNFWIPDEVDMKLDARQYGELNAREKNAYDSIIGLRPRSIRRRRASSTTSPSTSPTRPRTPMRRSSASRK